MDNFRDSYFQVDWDLTTKRLKGTYWGKQYDTGRGFAVTVINGGQVVAPTTEVLRLKWEKPDNTTGYVNATIVNGKFIVEKIDQMFTVAGSVRADFELSVAGESLASITFYVSVEKAVAVDAIESSSDFTALQVAIATADSIDAQLAHISTEKITKGQAIASDFDTSSDANKLKIINLSDEVKQAMAGTTSINASVADGAVVKEKIANGAVYPNKMNGNIPQSNLINPNEVIEGFYVSETTGDLLVNASYGATDYIPIKASADYYFKGGYRVAYYNASKVFISGHNAIKKITTPATAAFIRLTVLLSTPSNSMLTETWHIPQLFKPYKVAVPWLNVTKDNIESIPPVTSYDISGAIRNINLFDKISCTDGYTVELNGELLGAPSVNASYTLSDFIPVKPETAYTLFYSHRYCLYDANKLAISGGTLTGIAEPTVESTIDSAYIRVAMLPQYKTEYMLVEGASYPSSYVPFGVSIPWMAYNKDQIINAIGYSKSKYEGKKMVCFGDSITYMGYADWIAADTGMTVINQGYSSQRYAYDVDPVKNAFSLYNLVLALTTDDYSIPDSIIGVEGFETQSAQLAILKTIDWNTVDFVSLAAGTNDFSSSTPIIDNPGNPYDTTNVVGAIRYCVKTLLEEYPHLKILICTPIYRFFLDDDGVTILSDSDTKTLAYKIPDMVDAIKAVGKELHIPIIDMYNEIGVNKYNRIWHFESTYSGLYDGTHPNERMREKMGHKIAGALLSIY